MDIRDMRESEFCGVTALHDEGYKGAGIVIWNISVDKDHDGCCENRILAAAPEATVITAGMGGEGDNNGYQGYVQYKGKRYTTEEFIDEHNISILTKSSVGPDGVYCNKEGHKKEYIKNLAKSRNLILIASAGNWCSSYTFDCPQGTEPAIMVGSCRLTTKPTLVVSNNDIHPNGDVDFVTFIGGDGQSGTSFAAPYLAGQCALLREKFGHDITENEMYQILVSCATENGTWRDKEMGYGLPRIQFAKRGEKPSEDNPSHNPNVDIIEFPIDKPYMIINGEQVPIDCPATIDKKTSRTLVPIRAVAESLGCEVEWDNKNRKVVIIHDKN